MSVDSEILAGTFTLPECFAFSLVNSYFPEGVISASHIDAVLSSCEKRVIMCGDFNSHRVWWGFRTDFCGRRLRGRVNDNNTYCYNSGLATLFRWMITFVLVLTSLNSGNISSWSTLDHGASSHHVPIVFEIVCTSRSPRSRLVRHTNLHHMQNKVKAALQSIPSGTEERRAVQVISILPDALRLLNTLSLPKKMAIAPGGMKIARGRIIKYRRLGR